MNDDVQKNKDRLRFGYPIHIFMKALLQKMKTVPKKNIMIAQKGYLRCLSSSAGNELLKVQITILTKWFYAEKTQTFAAHGKGFFILSGIFAKNEHHGPKPHLLLRISPSGLNSRLCFV
jgi:hypothetical protein